MGAVGGVAAATLLAVALVTTRGDTEDPRPVGPVVDNPADVSWTDGFTPAPGPHRPHGRGRASTTWSRGTVRVAEAGGGYGVVYASLRRGRRPHRLARQDPDHRPHRPVPDVRRRLACLPWGAWVDATEGRPALVVHDTATNKQVIREPLPAAALAGPAADPARRPMAIAVDGQRNWVRTLTGDLVWSRAGRSRRRRTPGRGSSTRPAGRSSPVPRIRRCRASSRSPRRAGRRTRFGAKGTLRCTRTAGTSSWGWLRSATRTWPGRSTTPRPASWSGSRRRHSAERRDRAGRAGRGVRGLRRRPQPDTAGGGPDRPRSSSARRL